MMFFHVMSWLWANSSPEQYHKLWLHNILYGFDRLLSRITSFFHWFWWLVGDAVFTYAGPLKRLKIWMVYCWKSLFTVEATQSSSNVFLLRLFIEFIGIEAYFESFAHDKMSFERKTGSLWFMLQWTDWGGGGEVTQSVGPVETWVSWSCVRIKDKGTLEDNRVL